MRRPFIAVSFLLLAIIHALPALAQNSVSGPRRYFIGVGVNEPLPELHLKFTHNDKELNKQFRPSAKDMVENAYREARDGQKFDY